MSILLTLAVLAAAQDGTMVRCAVAKTPRAELASIQKATVAGVTANTAPAAATEALLAKLRTRAAECNPGSGRADSRAGEIVVASVVVESLSGELQSRGVDVLAISDRLRRTPAATLDQLLAKSRSPAVQALGREVVTLAGERGKQPAVARLIGGYMFNVVRLAKLFASSAS